MSTEQSLLERAVRKFGAEAVFNRLSEPERKRLPYEWRIWARPSQLAPLGDWRFWLAQCGRGWGKSKAGSCWVREQAETPDKSHGALVGRSAADVRDVMVEGSSGILASSPPEWRPKYEPSKRRLTWKNGTTATTYSADQPEELRGANLSWFWADELGAWRQVVRREHARSGLSRAEETWSNLDLALRIGMKPRGIITTTPRATKLMRRVASLPNVVVTRGSTRDNIANLAPDVVAALERAWGGTRLGRQELDGELLQDVEGALWTLEMIERDRFDTGTEFEGGYDEIVVGVDPALTEGGDGAEAGIMVAGRIDDHFYVLADLSLAASPTTWGRAVINAVHSMHASAAVVEKNAGHALLTALLRGIERTDALQGIERMPVRIVMVNARTSKHARAEPVSALYEQRRVHHIGHFPKLESQLAEWIPGSKSPDRLDALVWAIHALMSGAQNLANVGHHEPAPDPIDPPPALADDHDAVRAEAEAMRARLRRMAGGD